LSVAHKTSSQLVARGTAHAFNYRDCSNRGVKRSGNISRWRGVDRSG